MSFHLHDWIYADWVKEQLVPEKWTVGNEAEIEWGGKKYNKDAVDEG